MIKKKLSKKLVNYKEICSFMKRVFPKEELMPMWIIRLLCLRKKYEFNVYYDNDMFIGITFTINSKESIFLFYLAVNDKIHSKGYGSKILNSIFEEYENKEVTLFIETMDDEDAVNYEQRLKRVAFYEKNGFIQTGFKAGFKSPFIDILSTNEDFNYKQAKKTLGIIPMKIF